MVALIREEVKRRDLDSRPSFCISFSYIILDSKGRNSKVVEVRENAKVAAKESFPIDVFGLYEVHGHVDMLLLICMPT